MNDYSKVYKELYEIFKYLPQEELNKIPSMFISKVEKRMDKEYEYKVVHIKDFEKQEMLKETRAIMAVLYRDYWASEEEKKEIKKQEQEEYLKIEKEKQEKCNVDVFYKIKRRKEEENIHKNLMEQEKIEKEAEKALVVYKESFLKKFIRRIISLFKKQ